MKKKWLVLLPIVIVMVSAMVVYTTVSGDRIGEDGNLRIATPYCELYYPGEWEPYLITKKTKENGYQVSFYADINGHEKQQIFDICFGEASGDYVGKIQTKDDTNIDVYVKSYVFTPDDRWSPDDAEIVNRMHEDMIVLLKNLPLLQEDISAQDAVDDVIIETPYCALYYPGKWKDYLQTQTVDDGHVTVAFYANVAEHEAQHLFDVHFDGTKGEDIGNILNQNGKKIAVRLETYVLEPDESWNQEQLDLVCAMQSGYSYLLERLPLTSEMAEELVEEKTGDVMVETPYCKLYYPAKFDKYFRVNCVENESYTVEFYATIENYEETHLFDIFFGGGKGQRVGKLTADGAEMEVFVETYPFEMGIDGSQKDVNSVNFLLGCIDHIIDRLPLEEEILETVPHEETIREEAEATEPMNVLIETPYCELKPSGRWTQSMRVVHSEEEVYSVEFYGITAGKGEMLLFTVMFGGEQENALAICTDEQGNKTAVHIVPEELVFTQYYSEEEKKNLYGMQEEINSILQNFAYQNGVELIY